MSRWSVRKRDGVWRVYDPRGCWHDSAESLRDAHTYALQLAVADELFEPGGLTRLRGLLWNERGVRSRGMGCCGTDDE